MRPKARPELGGSDARPARGSGDRLAGGAKLRAPSPAVPGGDAGGGRSNGRFRAGRPRTGNWRVSGRKQGISVVDALTVFTPLGVIFLVVVWFGVFNVSR